MPFADVRGERIYYEVTGEGPPLVLIRGLSRSMRFWDAFLACVQDRYTVLAFDHRGIGRSPINRRDFTLDDLVEDMAATMTAAGIRKAHILGLSMGGMVAQRFALAHAERVDKLILGATTARFSLRHPPRIDTFAVIGVASKLPTALGNRVMAPRIVSPAFHRGNPHIADNWLTYLEQEPIDPLVVRRQAFSALRHNVEAHLPAIKAPTLVLHGDADRLIPMGSSRVLASKIPNARLHVLPGVGHDLTAEASPQVARLVNAFVLGEEAPADRD